MKKIFFNLKNIFISARPTTWIRIFAEMFLGFAFAQTSSIIDFFRFFIGFISVGPLLWSGAYMLNDITDKNVDKKHPLRSQRPITKGELSSELSIKIIVILVITSFAIGFFVQGLNFIFGMFILSISQILYTLKPFRLKEKFPFDLVLNGINTAIRFGLGYLLGVNNFSHFPVIFLLFVITIKLIFFIGHRLQSRSIEIANKFKSTVTVLNFKTIKIIMILLLITSMFLYFFSIYYYHLGTNMFIPPIVASFISLPFFLFLKKGYLFKEEESISWRIYLYTIYFLFSVLVFITIKIWR